MRPQVEGKVGFTQSFTAAGVGNLVSFQKPAPCDGPVLPGGARAGAPADAANGRAS